MRDNEFVPSSFSGAGKPVQSNESVAGVEELMLRGKRYRDWNSVQTMSDRQNLHEFLKRKAESAVRERNCSSEKII